jgi:integral membrane sensor domain MASE1
MPQILCRRGRPPEFPHLAGLLFAVGLAAWNGIVSAAVAGRIVTIWLANGFVLAGLSRAALRLRPAHPVSGFGGNLAADPPSGDSLPLGLNNSLDIVATADPSRWSFVFTHDLSEIRQFARYLTGAGCLAPETAQPAHAER